MCTSASWISTSALAQEAAASALRMTRPSPSWTLYGRQSETAPHLVIAMLDRGDIALSRSHREPNAGIGGLTHFRTEPEFPAIETSADQAGARVYSLLDNRSAVGSFQYRYQRNYVLSEQLLAFSATSPPEVEPAARPLFQVESGARLPVLLILLSSSGRRF
jgi:hypothetical protein